MNFDVEVKLLLAPTKARQAYMATLAASRMFEEMHGHVPSSDALQNRFIAELIAIDGTESDIQWLIDEALLHVDVLAGWKVALSEHA